MNPIARYGLMITGAIYCLAALVRLYAEVIA